MKRVEIKSSYLGLIIALIFVGCRYLFGRVNTLTEVFLRVTDFLFWFYLVISVMWIVFTVLGRFFLSKTRQKTEPHPSLFRSFLIPVVINGCLVVGVYLLHHALKITNANSEWNMIRLVLGGTLLIIGSIWARAKIGLDVS